MTDPSRMPDDGRARHMQVFSPRAVVTVTSGAAYNVSTNNVRAFAVGSDCTYYMDSDTGHTATLLAGSVRGVGTDVSTVTFDTSMEIEIM